MGRAKPDVRPPGAASPSGKSIWVVEIPLAAMQLANVSKNCSILESRGVCLQCTSSREKFREDNPTSPEVIEAHTLNFKPNFKFSRLKFFWETLT